VAREENHIKILALISTPTPLEREEMNEKYDDTNQKASYIVVSKLKKRV
jgi:hypothetical protein